MTPSINLRDDEAPISAVTLQSMADIGYEVDVSWADPAVNHDTDLKMVGLFESVMMDGAARGPLEWRRGEDEGTCGIDMTLAAEAKVDQDTPTIGGAF